MLRVPFFHLSLLAISVGSLRELIHLSLLSPPFPLLQDEVLSLHAQRHPHSAIAARLAQAPSHSHFPANSHKKGAAASRAVQAVVIKKTKKSARAYAKTYLPPPPLVPAKILGDIAEYVAKMPGRKKKELIELVGRYWSLKREARRGAPLLKRLHLEVSVFVDDLEREEILNEASMGC